MSKEVRTMEKAIELVSDNSTGKLDLGELNKHLSDGWTVGWTQALEVSAGASVAIRRGNCLVILQKEVEVE